MKSERRIRVLVVEDSRLMAREIIRALRTEPTIQVVGHASNGEEGRQMNFVLEPNVVTLDINMPRMDGLTCLQYIMVERPTPCVVISALTRESALETFEAYELGAVAVVEKPDATSTGGAIERFKRQIIAQVIRASHANLAALERARLDPSRRPHHTTARRDAPRAVPRRLVVIGASTGGPRALMEILPGLPADLDAAVLIIQHLPGHFTTPFAAQLRAYSRLPVDEARDGDALESGRVYLAPGGFHVTLERTGVGYSSTFGLISEHARPDAFVIPSIDIGMMSALEIFGADLVGVILTGLGDDGARAMEATRRAGGTTIVESLTSAIMTGMPRAVIERQAASHILPARMIGRAITRAIEEGDA